MDISFSLSPIQITSSLSIPNISQNFLTAIPFEVPLLITSKFIFPELTTSKSSCFLNSSFASLKESTFSEKSIHFKISLSAFSNKVSQLAFSIISILSSSLFLLFINLYGCSSPISLLDITILQPLKCLFKLYFSPIV